MSDNYRVIVDPVVSESEAPEFAASILSWLAGDGIVVNEQTDCALGSLAHAPGPDVDKALADGWEPYAWLLELGVNGMEISIGRKWFWAREFARDGPVRCPQCDTARQTGDEWSDAIDEWCRTGHALVTCPGCKHASPLPTWKAAPDWAFGHLGFTFWNWPDLREAFVVEFSRRLGHPVEQFIGRLRAAEDFRACVNLPSPVEREGPSAPTQGEPASARPGGEGPPHTCAEILPQDYDFTCSI